MNVSHGHKTKGEDTSFASQNRGESIDAWPQTPYSQCLTNKRTQVPSSLARTYNQFGVIQNVEEYVRRQVQKVIAYVFQVHEVFLHNREELRSSTRTYTNNVTSTCDDWFKDCH